VTNEPSAHVGVPSEPDLEMTAWSMIAAEGGGLALVLTIGLTVLWRWSSAMVSRFITAQATALDRLQASQSAAIDKLGEKVGQVEHAIVRSDLHNQAALSNLRETVATYGSRLDRHGAELERHGAVLDRHEQAIGGHERRLTVLEVPKSGP
jgi:hypothetical protein